MKQLIEWMHAHPFKVAFFSSVFTGIPLLAATTDHLLLPCLVAWVFALLIWLITIKLDVTRKPKRGLSSVLTAILAMVFLVPDLPAQALPPEDEPIFEPASFVGPAIVVVVVGGLVVYLGGRFCKKYLDKPPKPNTNGVSVLALAGYGGDASSYAAGWSGFASCTVLPATPEDSIEALANSKLLEVSMIMDLSPTGLTYRVKPPVEVPVSADTVTDFAGFQAGLAEWGLNFLAQPGSSCFAVNRRPATQDEVPLRLEANGVVVIEPPGWISWPVILERSRDLVTWEPLARMNVLPGLEVKMRDAVDIDAACTFYRMRPQ